MQLTDRQQQIKGRLEQGQKADEIASALNITTNAVYQQIRRMRQGGAKVGTKASGAKKSGRQSGRKPRAAAAPKPTPAPAPEPEVVTPLQAIRHRRSVIREELKAAETNAAEAQKHAERAKEIHTKLAEKHKEELASLDKAEGHLTGKPVVRPAKRTSRKTAATAGSNGSNGGEKTEAPTPTPALAAAPEPEPTPAA